MNTSILLLLSLLLFWLCWVLIAVHGLSSVAASRNCSLVAVRGLLIVMAFPVVEYGL